jgi:hypothetical protein
VNCVDEADQPPRITMGTSTTAKTRAQAPVNERPRKFPMTRLSRQRRGYGSTAGLRKRALVTEDDDGGGAAGRAGCYVFGE